MNRRVLRGNNAMKARGEKIAALTAYVFSVARLLDQAGIPLDSRWRFPAWLFSVTRTQPR